MSSPHVEGTRSAGVDRAIAQARHRAADQRRLSISGELIVGHLNGTFPSQIPDQDPRVHFMSWQLANVLRPAENAAYVASFASAVGDHSVPSTRGPASPSELRGRRLGIGRITVAIVAAAVMVVVSFFQGVLDPMAVTGAGVGLGGLAIAIGVITGLYNSTANNSTALRRTEPAPAINRTAHGPEGVIPPLGRSWPRGRRGRRLGMGRITVAIVAAAVMVVVSFFQGVLDPMAVTGAGVGLGGLAIAIGVITGLYNSTANNSTALRRTEPAPAINRTAHGPEGVIPGWCYTNDGSEHGDSWDDGYLNSFYDAGSATMQPRMAKKGSTELVAVGSGTDQPR